MWLKVVEEGSTLKIVWGKDDGEFGNYSVSAGYVLEASRKTREELDLLSASYDRAVDAKTGLVVNEAAVLPVLARLATAGRYLYDNILPTGKAAREKLKAQLARHRARDKKLNIHASTDFAIPFGLVFERDPAALPGTVQAIFDEGGFWGSQLQVSGMPGIKDTLPESYHDVTLVALLNREEYRKATTGLKTPSMTSVEALLGRRLGRVYTVAGFNQFVQQASNSNAIVYFYGHCADQVLHLSEKETLSAMELNSKLSEFSPMDGQSDQRSIVFLNACYTGITGKKNDFLTACHREGLCGFIGSEATLPNRFAIRYGHAFLTEVIENGLSVGDTITALMTRFWPYSLLYCCYANPDFRVAASSIGVALPAPHARAPSQVLAGA